MRARITVPTINSKSQFLAPQPPAAVVRILLTILNIPRNVVMAATFLRKTSLNNLSLVRTLLVLKSVDIIGSLQLKPTANTSS